MATLLDRRAKECRRAGAAALFPNKQARTHSPAPGGLARRPTRHTPGVCVPPWPDELFGEVIAQLELPPIGTRSLGDLKAVRQVSRAFADLVDWRHPQWRERAVSAQARRYLRSAESAMPASLASALPHVRRLDLSNTPLVAAHRVLYRAKLCMVLQRSDSLAELDLANNRLMACDVAHLGLRHARQLRTVCIDGNAVDGDGIAALCAELPLGATSLLFRGTHRQGRQANQNLWPMLPSLTHLDVSYNVWSMERTEAPCVPLAHMPALTSLTARAITSPLSLLTWDWSQIPSLCALDVSQNALRDDEVLALAAKHQRGVAHLDLSSTLITGHTLALLPTAWRQALRTLRVARNDLRVDERMPWSLGDAVWLRELDASRCQLGSDVLRLGLGALQQLQVLRLSSNNLHDAGVLQLPWSAWPKLRELHLDANQLTAKSLSHLNDQPFGGLRVLEASINLFGVGIEPLLFDRGLRHLQVLRLTHTHLTGATPLVFAAKSPLRELDMSNNRLGSLGAWNLLLPCTPKLESLRLFNNGLGPIGARMLPLQHAPQLRVLDLGCNAIGNEGLAALRLQHTPFLRVLDLSNNALSDVLGLERHLLTLRCMEVLTLHKNHFHFFSLRLVAWEKHAGLRCVYLAHNPLQIAERKRLKRLFAGGQGRCVLKF